MIKVLTNNELFYNLPINVIKNPTLFLGKYYFIANDDIEILNKNLITSHDFNCIISYFLFSFYNMRIDVFDGNVELTITSTLSILNNRYEQMKNYINKYKPMIMIINFL